MVTARQCSGRSTLRAATPLRSVRVTSWMIASLALCHGGCFSLTLPPNGVDSGGAGGTYAELGPAIPSGDVTVADVIAGTDQSATAGTGGDGAVPARGGTGGAAVNASGGSAGAAAAGGTAGSGLDASPDENAAGSGGAAGSKDVAATGGDVDAAPDVPQDAWPNDVLPDAPAVAPTTGLIVYYSCEQADGSNLQDLSGKGNSGQIIAQASAGFRFDSGRIGKGLTFSEGGGSGYVSLSPAIFRSATALTVATWIRLNTLTTGQRLFEVGVNAKLSQDVATGTAYLTLFVHDPNGKFGLSSTNNGYSSAVQVTADGLDPGVWRHVAFVLGRGAATLYLDGAPVGTVSAILPPKSLGAVDYAVIGKSQFSDDPFLDAEIDEFRVYDRALTADEIRATFEYSGP
jgi:uncharacterized protein